MMISSYARDERRGNIADMDDRRDRNGEHLASHEDAASSSSMSASRSTRLAVSDLLAGPEKGTPGGDQSSGSPRQANEATERHHGYAERDPPSKSYKEYAGCGKELDHRSTSLRGSLWHDERENRPAAGVAMNHPRDRSSSTSSGPPRAAPSAPGFPGSSESAPPAPGDGITAYQYAAVQQITEDRANIEYILTIREQPKHSRMCGVGEKADRRPIDPAPIIQLRVITHDHPEPKDKAGRTEGEGSRDGQQKEKATEVRPLQEARSGIVNTTVGRSGKDIVLRRGVPVRTDWGEGWEDKTWYLENPYYFMYAMLADAETDEELHLLGDGKTRYTTGSCVSCLYHLKDIDGSEQGFFVFPDLSIRVEGRYRLKLCLFETIGHEVHHCKSVYSTPFNVYTAKRFPGMEESTPLSKSFADQGLKVRVRKNPRARRQRGVAGIGKRKEAAQSDEDSEGDGDMTAPLQASASSPSFKRPRNLVERQDHPSRAVSGNDRAPYETYSNKQQAEAQQWRPATLTNEPRYEASHQREARGQEMSMRTQQYNGSQAMQSPDYARTRYEEMPTAREERYPTYVPSQGGHDRSGPPPLPALRGPHVSGSVREVQPAYASSAGARSGADYRAMESDYEQRYRQPDPRRPYESSREYERHLATERAEYEQRYGAPREQMSAAQRARGYTMYEGGRLPEPSDGYMRRRSPPPLDMRERLAPVAPLPSQRQAGLAPPVSPSRYLDTRDRAVSDPYGQPHMSHGREMPHRPMGGSDMRSGTRLPPMHVALAGETSQREPLRHFSGPGGGEAGRLAARPPLPSYYTDRPELSSYHTSPSAMAQTTRLPVEMSAEYRDREARGGAPYEYGGAQRSAGSSRPVSPLQQHQGAYMHPPPPPPGVAGARYSPQTLHRDRAQHLPPPMAMPAPIERAGPRLPPPPSLASSSSSPSGERRLAHPPPPPPPHHQYSSFGRRG